MPRRNNRTRSRRRPIRWEPPSTELSEDDIARNLVKQGKASPAILDRNRGRDLETRGVGRISEGQAP